MDLDTNISVEWLRYIGANFCGTDIRAIKPSKMRLSLQTWSNEIGITLISVIASFPHSSSFLLRGEDGTYYLHACESELFYVIGTSRNDVRKHLRRGTDWAKVKCIDPMGRRLLLERQLHSKELEELSASLRQGRNDTNI